MLGRQLPIIFIARDIYFISELHCKKLNAQRLLLTAESDISEIGHSTTAEIFLNVNPVYNKIVVKSQATCINSHL